MKKSIKNILNFSDEINIDETTKFNIFKQNEEGGMGSISFGIVEFEDLDDVNCWAMKNVKIDEISEENLEKFENEAKLWIKLKHPNILRAFYYKIINEIPRIFMEPIISEDNKITLEDYICDDLNLKTILNWSIQFCHGMIYANNNGVAVHRDIKPANILIKDNLLKISDFGISANHFIQDDNKILSGTMEFKAPETFEGFADVKGDIYSWGMVMYNLIKKDLFIYDYLIPENEQNLDMFEYYKLLHQKGYIFGFQHPLKHIILKCLDKNPNNRYENFSKLLEDLQSVFMESFDKNEMYVPCIKEYDEIDLTSLLFSNIELNNENIDEKLEELAINKNMYSVLGTIYQEIDDEEKSIKSFNKAINEFPNEFGIRYDYATSLSKMKKYKESEEQFKIAIKLNPNNKPCHVNYGILLMDTNRFESAVTEYKTVLKDDPNFFKANLNLMLCYIKMNDFQKSDEIYERIKYNNSFTKEHEISRANWTANQNFTKAKKIFEELEYKYPNDWKVLSEIGYFYYINGKYSQSINYFEKFLNVCPNVKKTIYYKAAATRYLARMYQDFGNLKKAYEYICISLSYEKTLNSHLTKIYILRGLFDTDDKYSVELNKEIKLFKKTYPNFINEAKEKCLTFIKDDLEEFFNTISMILIFEPDFDYEKYYKIY